MLSSMPGVAQLHSCHLAHIHDHRVFHPFQSLAITSRRCQHWRSPVLSRRQSEVLPGPTCKQESTPCFNPNCAVQHVRTGGVLCSLCKQWRTERCVQLFCMSSVHARVLLQPKELTSRIHGLRLSISFQIRHVHNRRLLNWLLRDRKNMIVEIGWVH